MLFNKSKITALNANITEVQVVNHQVVLTGTNFNSVTGFKIINGVSTNNLLIESKSDTIIIANAVTNVSFAVGTIFDFVLSNANAAATFQVAFTNTNNSITASMLTSMGATKGQIMKYNGVVWVPSSITNAQTYLGTFDAFTNNPDLSSPSSTPGDYFIVSIAGTQNLISYAVGDWIISDGYNWQKVANSSVVVSTYNGRRGIVITTPSDYVLLKNGSGKLSSSSINDLADVNIATPLNGSVLKYDSATSKWIVGIDNSGGGVYTGPLNKAVITDGTTGVLTNSTTTAAELGFVSGVTSSIQSQFNTKQTSTLTSGNILVGNGSNVASGVAMSGDATLSNTGVINFKNTGIAGTYTSVTTDAQGRVNGGTNPAAVASITGLAPVSVGGSAIAPIVSMTAATTAVNGYLTNTDWNTFNTKQASLLAGTTVNGIVYPANGAQTLQITLAPVALTDAVNKQYVDSLTAGAWSASSSNIYRASGLVGIGTSLPQTTLDVNGSVRVGVDATACSVPIAGAMRFNNPNVEFCNGTSWISVVATSISSAQITDGTIINADINASAAIDAAKINTGIVSNAEFNFLDGVTSAIQTQINAKEPLISAVAATNYFRGDKTFVDLATDVRGSLLTGLSSTAGTIATGDTVLGAFGKILNTQSDYVSKSANSTITGTLTINSIVGALTVPTPVNPNDAVNKSYVDSFGQWQLNGSSAYRLSGNVGIGTTAPTATLHVVTGGGVIFERAAKQITLNPNKFASGVTAVISSGTSGAPTTMDLLLQAGNDDLSNGLVIKQSGYVGIGTTAPLSLLTVAGSISWPIGIGAISQLLGPSDQTFTIGPAVGTGAANVNGAGISLTAASGYKPLNGFVTGGGITLTAGNASASGTGSGAQGGSINIISGNSVVTGTGGGFNWNGGIGGGGNGGANGAGGPLSLIAGVGGNNNSAPGALGGSVLVRSGAGSNTTAAIVAGGSGAFTIATGTAGNSTGGGTGGTSGNILIQTGVAGTGTIAGSAGNITLGVGGATNLFINPSGNIGVGTTAPTYQLQLSSDSAAKPGTSTWTIASDARLKNIRAPFTRGLQAMEGIHPIYFNYKLGNELNLPSEKEFVGIIAQDAKKMVPEAVQVDDQGFLHVTNDSIIWTMFNGVKELYAQLKTLILRVIHLENNEVIQKRAIASVDEKTKKLEAKLQSKDLEIQLLKARLDKLEKALK